MVFEDGRISSAARANASGVTAAHPKFVSADGGVIERIAFIGLPKPLPSGAD